MNTQNLKSNSRNSRVLVTVAAVALAMEMGVPFVSAQQRVAASGGTEAGDRVTVNLSDPSRPATVKASLLNGSIIVKGYDGKEIIVEAHPRAGTWRGKGRRDEDEDDSARRKQGDSSDRPSSAGMKRLEVAATGLTVEEESNQVRISTESVNRSIELTISVPRQTSLVLRTVNGGDIEVTGVTGDMDVNNTNGAVKLDHISGSAIAHALNGTVRVVFDHTTQKPMAFSSLNGAIDVTFPADLKANLTIKSDRGDVYSDFDVQLKAGASQQIVEDGRSQGGTYRVKIDKGIYGTIGGGGPEIQFRNFNGSIYIRKAGVAHE